MNKTIEIDCAPCTPRPDAYIKAVIEGTGLPEREKVSTCFGNWTWDYSDIDDETWEKAQPLLAERIDGLYKAGKIRYGSW